MTVARNLLPYVAELLGAKAKYRYRAGVMNVIWLAHQPQLLPH
ncbi:MAG TPA: hypothetical protein VNH18_34955 [Bryobacteraceae bacterium]|nr:hypothetical protein [Bryobacteraceae bacterium]